MCVCFVKLYQERQKADSLSPRRMIAGLHRGFGVAQIRLISRAAGRLDDYALRHALSIISLEFSAR